MNKFIIKHNISRDFNKDLFVKSTFEIPEDSTLEQYIELISSMLITIGFSADMVKERLFEEETDININIEEETDL